MFNKPLDSSSAVGVKLNEKINYMVYLDAVTMLYIYIYTHTHTHTYTHTHTHIYIYTVTPRLTSDPAKEFFG